MVKNYWKRRAVKRNWQGHFYTVLRRRYQDLILLILAITAIIIFYGKIL